MTQSPSTPSVVQVKDEVRLDVPGLVKLLKPPEPRPTTVWIWSAVALFLVIASVLIFFPLDDEWKRYVLVVAFLVVLWCSVIVQLRWKNGFATTIVFVGGTTIVLLAGDYITPGDVPDMLRR